MDFNKIAYLLIAGIVVGAILIIIGLIKSSGKKEVYFRKDFKTKPLAPVVSATECPWCRKTNEDKPGGLCPDCGRNKNAFSRSIV